MWNLLLIFFIGDLGGGVSENTSLARYFGWSRKDQLYERKIFGMVALPSENCKVIEKLVSLEAKRNEE
jgi:hypothetical protein